MTTIEAGAGAAMLPSVPDRRSPENRRSTPEEREKVASQFEAVMLSMMIKQLRQTGGEGLFPGDHADTFGGMFDMYMGQHLAEAGGLGIGRLLEPAAPQTRLNPGIGPASDPDTQPAAVNAAARRTYQNVSSTIH